LKQHKGLIHGVCTLLRGWPDSPGTFLELVTCIVQKHVALYGPRDPVDSSEPPVLIISTGGTFSQKQRHPDHPLEVSKRGDLLDRLRSFPSFAGRLLDFSEWKEGKTGGFVLLELHDRIDSTEATFTHWNLLAALVYLYASKSDRNGPILGTPLDQIAPVKGVVIIHGTDTLAHAAAALSFMISQLSIPVVLTGAQVPIFYDNSDALGNLLGACEVASGSLPDAFYHTPSVVPMPSIAGVFVYFDNKLLHGARVLKTHSQFRRFYIPKHRSCRIASWSVGSQQARNHQDRKASATELQWTFENRFCASRPSHRRYSTLPWLRFFSLRSCNQQMLARPHGFCHIHLRQLPKSGRT